MNLHAQIGNDVLSAGFVLVPSLVDSTELNRLRLAADHSAQHPLARTRRGSAFGLRNLFTTMPCARELAWSTPLRGLVQMILGAAARPVNGVLFDKTEQANWSVPWHQDLTISVKERRSVPGFDAWSEKDGVPHVQPPVQILESMLTVRLHLDSCPPDNGPLKVIPGSHAEGRLPDDAVEHWRTTVSAVICAAQAGDALLMRPLLLHCSSAAMVPGRRRVLHFEYAAAALPGGLEWNE